MVAIAEDDRSGVAKAEVELMLLRDFRWGWVDVGGGDARSGNVKLSDLRGREGGEGDRWAVVEILKVEAV